MACGEFVELALGIAHGLAYLHERARRGVWPSYPSCFFLLIFSFLFDLLSSVSPRARSVGAAAVSFFLSVRLITPPCTPTTSASGVNQK